MTRLKDLPVFLLCLLLVIQERKVNPEIAIHLSMLSFDQCEETRTICRSVERGMKFPVDLTPLSDSCGWLVSLVENFLCAFERLFREMWQRKAQSSRLKSNARPLTGRGNALGNSSSLPP